MSATTPRHHSLCIPANTTEFRGSTVASLLQWTTRVWNLQEAMLSRQVIYVVGEQLADGDYVSELAAFIQSFSEVYSAGRELNQWIGGYASYR